MTTTDTASPGDALPQEEMRRGARYLLHDEATLAQVARDAIVVAQTVSKGRAIAFAHESGGVSVSIAQGEVVSAERQGAQMLSVTIVDQRRRGSASTGVFTADAIRATVERAAFIATQVEPDPDGDLADPEDLAREAPDVPLYAPSGLGADALAAIARDIEDAARDAVSRQADEVRVMETAVSTNEDRWARAIGADFCRTGSAAMQGHSTQVIASRDQRMASAYWFSSERRLQTMRSPAEIGQTAVARAVRKLGARGLETRDCPILFDATEAASLVNDLAGALSGGAQHQKATFLPDALGASVMASHLNLIEDPLEPYGLASGAFDDEGIAGSRRAIVRDGVAEGYFLATHSARKLGLKSTGNANGPWNLTLTSAKTAASDDLPAMLMRMGKGLWVTDLLGGGFDPVTGAYSKAVAGLWVEYGEVVHAVENVTIAGNLKDMLLGIAHVGAGVLRSGRVRTGPLLIERMRVAGR